MKQKYIKIGMTVIGLVAICRIAYESGKALFYAITF